LVNGRAHCPPFSELDSPSNAHKGSVVRAVIHRDSARSSPFEWGGKTSLPKPQPVR
jgi:hypothetical protein